MASDVSSLSKMIPKKGLGKSLRHPSLAPSLAHNFATIAFRSLISSNRLMFLFVPDTDAPNGLLSCDGFNMKLQCEHIVDTSCFSTSLRSKRGSGCCAMDSI